MARATYTRNIFTEYMIEHAAVCLSICYNLFCIKHNTTHISLNIKTTTTVIIQ